MKSILIVEDESALLDAYTLLFEIQNFTVYQASNGKTALSLLAKHTPDYVILDILMPVMGGVEFLEAAKIKQNYPETKVLVLSNLSDQKTIDIVMKLGASKYLLKAGASPTQLIEAIKSL